MKFAIIESGVVVNVVEAEEDFALEQGWVPATAWVGIGDSYDGQQFTQSPPQVQVPASVPRRQAMAVLIKYGHDVTIDALLQQQLTGAQNSGDAQAILSAKLAMNDWLQSQEFQRNWPTLLAVSAMLAWTPEYVDNLFIEAKTL
jgi:hypothetical protein